MLCPSCGTNVGDQPVLCERCAAEWEQRRIAKAAEVKEVPKKRMPKIEREAFAWSSFMYTTPGIILACLGFHFFLWIAFYIVIPKVPFVQAGLYALVIAGMICGYGSKWAFAFDHDESMRKPAVRFGGYGLAILGVILLSLYTGKNPQEVYNTLNQTFLAEEDQIDADADYASPPAGTPAYQSDDPY